MNLNIDPIKIAQNRIEGEHNDDVCGLVQPDWTFGPRLFLLQNSSFKKYTSVSEEFYPHSDLSHLIG